jgi:hypothetical protein
MSTELDKKVRNLTIQCVIAIAIVIISGAIALTYLYNHIPQE